MHPRFLLPRSSASALLATIAAVALTACSNMSGSSAPSGMSAAAQSVVPHDDSLYEIRIRYANNIDAYTWVTFYSSYPWEIPWHIETAHCVAPGADYDTTLKYQQRAAQARIRIEPRSKKDCQGSNLPGGDVTGPKCDADFGGGVIGVIYAYVEGYGSKNGYAVGPFKRINADTRPPCNK
jgi:hypothetical protein